MTLENTQAIAKVIKCFMVLLLFVIVGAQRLLSAQTPTRAPVSLPQTVRTTMSLVSKETLEIVLVSDLPSAVSVIVRVTRCWPAGVPSAK